MSDSLVIIPAWQRADLLRACLIRLSVCDDGQRRYLISLDRGYSRAVTEAAWEFEASFPGRVRLRFVDDHPYHGNSFNVMTSVKQALADGVEEFHIVEEDILVGKDYFTAHTQAWQLTPDAFSVCAAANPHDEEIADPDERALRLHPAYHPCGVSFPRHTAELVVQHAVPEYFGDMGGYAQRAFPDSKRSFMYGEQDSIFYRECERTGGMNAYMEAPRAYHAGYHGYNRPGAALGGDPRENAEKILAMTGDDLNALADGWNDYSSVDLDAPRQPLSVVRNRQG